jgi:hypothetical protein
MRSLNRNNSNLKTKINEIVPNLNEAIAPQQTNNTQQRSHLISSKSDLLKYPYFHYTRDRHSTNQQHQTAIALLSYERRYYEQYVED